MQHGAVCGGAGDGAVQLAAGPDGKGAVYGGLYPWMEIGKGAGIYKCREEDRRWISVFLALDM